MGKVITKFTVNGIEHAVEVESGKVKVVAVETNDVVNERLITDEQADEIIQTIKPQTR